MALHDLEVLELLLHNRWMGQDGPCTPLLQLPFIPSPFFSLLLLLHGSRALCCKQPRVEALSRGTLDCCLSMGPRGRPIAGAGSSDGAAAATAVMLVRLALLLEFEEQE